MIGALIAAASALAQPTVLFSVPAEYRLIEGVAMDGRTIWVSSVLDRKIDGEMMVLVGDAGWEGASKGAVRTGPTPILAYDPPESCEN